MPISITKVENYHYQIAIRFPTHFHVKISIGFSTNMFVFVLY